MKRFPKHTKKHISLAFIVLLTTSMQGCGGGTSVEEHLQQAQISFAKYDFKSTEIELKNALQQDVNNSAARLLLGQIYLTIGNGSAAAIEIDKAIQIGSPPNIAFPLLGDALLLDRKADEILKRFAFDPTETDSLKAIKATYRGDANLQLQGIENAKKDYQTALQLDGQYDKAVLGMARVAIYERQPDKALTLVNSVLSKDESNVIALLTKGDVYRSLGNKPEAIATFTLAQNATKDPKDYLYFLATRSLIIDHIRSGNFTEAEQQLEVLAKGTHRQQISNDIMLKYAQVFIAYNKKDLITAKEIAEKIVADTNNHPELLLLLGSINMQNKNFEQAESQLKAFLAAAPGHKQATHLLATLQVNEKHPEQAVETLKQALGDSETPDISTLTLLASASLLSGDSEQGVLYYQKALEQKPEESTLIFGLGQSYIMEKEYDKAITEFTKIPSGSEQNIKAQLAIIETYIKTGRLEEARTAVDKLPNELQQTSLITSLKGSIHLMDKRPDDAEAELNKALTIEPGYAPALRQLALLSIQKGDSVSAIKHFDEAIKYNPENVNLHIDYAGYQMLLGDLKKAELLLLQAKKIGSSEERVATSLARLYIRQLNTSSAIGELAPFNDSSNPETQAEIGNARMLMGEPELALSAYEKVVAVRDNSPLAHYLTYTALSALNKTEPALTALQKTLELDDKFVPGLLASAQIAIFKRKAEEADEWLNQIKKIDANNHSAKILQADNAVLQSKSDEAITLYKSAYSEKPNNLVAQKITQAHQKSNKQNEAINFLNEAILTQPNNAFLPYLLGELYLQTGNTEQAINAYKHSIDLKDDNVIALNNVAWLLKESDTKQARIYAEKAAKLAPGNKDIEDTLAEIKRLDK